MCSSSGATTVEPVGARVVPVIAPAWHAAVETTQGRAPFAFQREVARLPGD
jgi:hypothetical protein